MKIQSIYDLLLIAPEEQVTRCQIAYRAVVAGQWADAVVSLRNAALEAGGEWAEQARALADSFEQKIAT